MKDNLFHGAPIFAPLDPIEIRICTNEDDLKNRFFEDIISLVPDRTELYITADAIRNVSHPQLREERFKFIKREIRQYKINLIQPPSEYQNEQDFHYDIERARRITMESALYRKPIWKL